MFGTMSGLAATDLRVSDFLEAPVSCELSGGGSAVKLEEKLVRVISHGSWREISANSMTRDQTSEAVRVDYARSASRLSLLEWDTHMRCQDL